ncbi:MFS transporter [Streptomyces fulvorobeus]|uniref:MFS family permease n=1 Tax=Streptomyces fulvorobeus TaxID=284028 RepID=A0A7J0C1E5_9ACTN|nr:MFS transporter [Streptomyces fulvorobeus]NYE39606.1 MFS family permease [Streptomyces fulvorobeus]GFM95847.1 MFS transporter [Streptomyces fulvorobeus]
MGREAGAGGRFSGPQVFLLAGSFLITLGSFAVLPYMSVLLHQRLGLGLGTVGVVLAVASLVQFSGSAAAGAVTGRIGLRATMLVALGLRTAGFAAFLPGMHSAVVSIGALLLVSCGAALYLPANKAYLVEGATEAERPRVLSAGSSAFNAGMALGPPAAAPFVLGSPLVLFSCVTLLFALVGAGHALLPPAGPGTAAPVSGASGGSRGGGPGPSPFAVTVLAVYVFMFFQHYLALYAVPRTSAAFYGAVLMGYAALLVVAQPLLSGWIAALTYPSAMRVGFGAMAAGTAAIGFGGYAGIGAGAVLMCLGEVVLFLKNDLEALARSSAPPAAVFGGQRLAAGIGAFASGVVGGQVYAAADAAGSAGGFWVAVCLQAVILPVCFLRRRTGPLRGSVRRRGSRRPPEKPGEPVRSGQ